MILKPFVAWRLGERIKSKVSHEGAGAQRKSRRYPLILKPFAAWRLGERRKRKVSHEGAGSQREKKEALFVNP